MGKTTLLDYTNKMNNKVKISIVVPVYKVSINLLKNCINSLINQTLKEIEIILVDDGSPDNCGKICDEFALKDKRIKVIHQENRGLSSARNTGVRNSSGEYIMFLDGDDFLESFSCKVLYKSTEKRKYDIVDACLMKQYGNNIVKFDYSKFIDKKEYLDDEVKFWQEEMLDFNGNVSSANAKIMNRKFLVNNEIYHNEDLKFGIEGIEFGIRLYEKAKSVLFLKEYIYHYVYNDKSITETFNEENIKLTLKGLKEIKKTIDKSSNKDKLYIMFYNRLLYAINTAAISGYFSPTNNDKYWVKKEKYKNYLKDNDIKLALKKLYFLDMTFSRKLTIYFIKFRLFMLISLIAKLRYFQKQKKVH